MTALMIIGAILLFLVALLALPLRLTIAYRDKVTLHLWVLCLPFRLYPPKKKKRSPQKYTRKGMERKRRRAERKAARKAARATKKEQKRAKRAAAHKKSPDTVSKKPTLWENIALVRALVACLFRKTGKHLRLKAARLHIRVATGDAASTAVLYGAVSASLAFLLSGLDRIVKLRTAKTGVSVTADYLSEKPSADIKLIFTLRVWGALALLLSAALTFLKAKSQKQAQPSPKPQATDPQALNDT